MENKVKSITEKVSQVTTLPDGFYYGTWGGSIVEVPIYRFVKRKKVVEEKTNENIDCPF